MGQDGAAGHDAARREAHEREAADAVHDVQHATLEGEEGAQHRAHGRESESAGHEKTAERRSRSPPQAIVLIGRECARRDHQVEQVQDDPAEDRMRTPARRSIRVERRAHDGLRTQPTGLRARSLDEPLGGSLRKRLHSSVAGQLNSEAFAGFGCRSFHPVGISN